MAPARTLGPGELLDAVARIATVLEDHAAALDRLELGSDWDEADPDAMGDAMGDARAPRSPPGGTTEDETAGPAAATTGRGAGSDLARTFAAAVATARPGSGLAELTETLTAGAIGAATGPAGQGAATVLGGLAESSRNADRFDAERFALGLELAAERMAPADDGCHAGCLPAVLAASADAALAALDEGADLLDVVVAAADDGLAELEAGPVANPGLVERGVVDPSAAGFLLVLDALASVLGGEPLPSPPMDPLESPSPVGAATVSRYRVSCRVEPNEGCGIESANWLESLWFELGELERFDPFEQRWDLTLVTAEPGRAIEALIEVGRPRDLRVVAVTPGA